MFEEDGAFYMKEELSRLLSTLMNPFFFLSALVLIITNYLLTSLALMSTPLDPFSILSSAASYSLSTAAPEAETFRAFFNSI